MPNPISLPFLHVTDPITGMPLAGGLVWTYAAGTSTQISTYSSWDPVGGFTGANSWPIALNNDGNCTMFLTAPTKIVVEYPPPVGQTHGAVLFTFPWIEAPPFNSYLILGSQVPPTPAAGQLGLYCSGNNLYLKDPNGVITAPATAQAIQQQSYTAASGGGVGDAITANFSPAITSLVDKILLFVWAPGANSTGTPTFSPNGLTPVTIVKDSNAVLIPGDIPGANFLMALQYNATIAKWVLLNPSPYNLLNQNNTVLSVKVSLTTLNSVATQLISLPIGGRRYRVVFSLLQNTTAGFLGLQFNSDTGANYMINNSGVFYNSLSGLSDNGGGKNQLNLSLNAASYYVGVGTPIAGNLLLIPNGNIVQVIGTTHYTGASGANYWSTVYVTGQYSGAATLTSLTINTSAGTLSGPVTVFLEP